MKSIHQSLFVQIDVHQSPIRSQEAHPRADGPQRQISLRLQIDARPHEGSWAPKGSTDNFKNGYREFGMEYI